MKKYLTYSLSPSQTVFRFLTGIIIFSFLLLQGCATVSRYYKDSNIHYAVRTQINNNPELKNNTHIVSTVYHRNVLLAGQVPLASQRILAGRIARTVRGVKHVYNEIEIAAPSSALTRSSDSWITTKIRSELFLAKNVDSNNIKVVTENGTVYLMGNISRNQANQAAQIASQVIGVQQVVKLFNYVNN